MASIRNICRTILFLLLTMTTMTTLAQADDQRQIEQLYERMYRAMIAKDTAALRPMFADDFCLVHMTGTRQSRSQYLAAIADGTLNYYDCQTEQLEVHIDGDSATLTGRSRVQAAVYGGGRHTWRLQLAFRLRREVDTWRFTYSTASTY